MFLAPASVLDVMFIFVLCGVARRSAVPDGVFWHRPRLSNRLGSKPARHYILLRFDLCSIIAAALSVCYSCLCVYIAGVAAVNFPASGSSVDVTVSTSLPAVSAIHIHSGCTCTSVLMLKLHDCFICVVLCCSTGYQWSCHDPHQCNLGLIKYCRIITEYNFYQSRLIVCERAHDCAPCRQGVCSPSSLLLCLLRCSWTFLAAKRLSWYFV